VWEVLRGPQGTLFGRRLRGGTVRYITTPPSLTKTSVSTAAPNSPPAQGGDPSYERGVASAARWSRVNSRATLVWYRKDRGWIDRIDPVTLATFGQERQP